MYKMKKIYNLFLVAMLAICCTSCNNEWEDEQFKQLVSFKATINGEGVSSTYVRYKPDGMVTYNLPLLLSGSIHLFFYYEFNLLFQILPAAKPNRSTLL